MHASLRERLTDSPVRAYRPEPRPALKNGAAESTWVTVAIFALTGAVAGMFAGGPVPAAMGFCLGLMGGAFANPLFVRIGYAAAIAALLFSGTSVYTTAALHDFETAQAQYLRHSLPAGSTFDTVYGYLKQRHAGNVRMATSKAHRSMSTLTADFDSRFLLSTYRLHTKFIFDKRERLASCSLAGYPVETALAVRPAFWSK